MHLKEIDLFCLKYTLHWEKTPIKITVLIAQYSCSIFIFLFILHFKIVKHMVYHTGINLQSEV